MRAIIAACGLLFCSSVSLLAQQPTPSDTVKTLPADTAFAADSAALAAEMAGMTTQATPPADQNRVGPTNPRLLPDFSAVGDFVADVSPHRSTQEDASRFSVREVELAVQAAVDPFFRGDIFLGISDEEGIAIEQAFLTTTSLPSSLELRLGRFLMPFSKQNTTHRHDLHTVEYPYVIQRFLGPEGLKGTGVALSKIFAPFGFYQELQLTATDLVDEAAEDLIVAERANAELSGLAYSARLRNYWDLTQSANIELSASALTARRPRAAEFRSCVPPVDGDAESCVNAINARQQMVGADITYRWRPLQQGLYKSFILQAEVMKQLNEDARDFSGAYLFARWQITARAYLGSRFDWLQDPIADGASLRAISAIYEFFPSEFSKLNATYERVMPGAGADAVDRLLLQASFSLGPHKPHPF